VARVLVVEDDGEIRDLIVVRLRLAGHSVVATEDAAGAFGAVDRIGGPDVYVLDVGLPDLDGFRLLERLRVVGEKAPAIFLSAHAQTRQAGRGAALGAAYLTKPFAAKILIEAIDNALAGREN
jgi:DNA-binding response OmpR family regulator